MRVLHVINSMDPKSGGPCQGIRNSFRSLKSLGVFKEVVCLDPKESDYLKTEAMIVHPLGKGKAALSYHEGLVPWLMRNLERFDVVIVNGIWQWPCIAVWIAMKRLKKNKTKKHLTGDHLTDKVPSYFVMPHGMLDPWFQKDRSRRLKAIRNWIFWKLIQHRVIRDADALLFTCEEEKRLARTTFSPYQPKQEINIGYGVPEPPAHTEAMDLAFRCTCPNLVKDQPYILFLSRIHHKKGVDLLIRAYVEVFGNQTTISPKTHPSSTNSSPFPTTNHPSPMNAIPALVIAGPLDSEYAKQMIRLAESLIPSAIYTPASVISTRNAITHKPVPVNRPAIHFTGMLQGDAKWGAMYGSEAFILPSHQENFGIAVVEAMACNKPVLISNSINIWREITTNNAGLADKDDLAGVLNLIRKWQNDPFAFEPRKAYIKNYNIDATSEMFLKILPKKI